MKKLRIAVFQRVPHFDDIYGAARHVLSDLEWCDAQGVQLALFPECYLQGFAADRETITRRSLTLDGDPIASILSMLSPPKTMAILGLIEQNGESYLDTAAVLQGGKLLGTYAKTHHNEPGFDRGTEYPIFNVDGWPFGINICHDANFPEPAAAVAGQGARLICYPLYNMLEADIATSWRQRNLENLRDRAVETGCWIASADVVGSQGTRISHGCSCIIRPDGTIAAIAPEGSETALVFDIDDGNDGVTEVGQSPK